MLVKEYRDGILLFNMMEKKVWNKGTEDTAGLKSFHTDNKAKYRYDTRAKVTIYSAANQKTLDNVKAKLAAGRFEVTDLKFEAVTFKKGKEIGLTKGATLKNISDNLKRDEKKESFIEIAGFSALFRPSHLSLQSLLFQ